METAEIVRRIDHTLLRPDAARADIDALCAQAARFCPASVCVPPSYVERAASLLGGRVAVCTVVGFPLGYQEPGAKREEVRLALAHGADEIDMVVNLGDVRSGEFARVTEEIASLKELAGSHVLKVIVETCLLTQEEKIALCGCVTQAGADFIKTSTGFGSAGAQLADIALFRSYIGPQVQIKAAGGIRTREQMEAFLQAGCSRIGTSAMVEALGL